MVAVAVVDRPLIFATTASGVSLPVIDVTDPRFRVPADPESLARRCAMFSEWARERQRLPKFVTRLLIRLASRRSRLLQALFQSGDSYLDGISTYVMKLGEGNLPPGFDSPIDRKIAASPHVPMLRLRMQQIAKLLAQALVELLERNAVAPLHFVNIAGGPALDSINTMILLRQIHRPLLDRQIVVHVLDSRSEGAAFGAKALAALQAADAPLHGLAVDFNHRPYDWNDTGPLVALLAELRQSGAIMAASSEGGLFEYGTDEAITANLAVLSRARVPLVAGSVTGSSDIRKRMIAETNFRLFPRGIEGFAPLAARAGYEIAASAPAMLSDQVLMRLPDV